MAELTECMFGFIGRKDDVVAIKTGSGEKGEQAICTLTRRCKKARVTIEKKTGSPALQSKLSALVKRAECRCQGGPFQSVDV